MISKEITLKNEEGLHARPATEIAKCASKYTCDIKVEVGGTQYNAKSVLNIMSAGIKNNTQIKIICDGVDENQALEEIVEIFENLPRGTEIMVKNKRTKIYYKLLLLPLSPSSVVKERKRMKIC